LCTWALHFNGSQNLAYCHCGSAFGLLTAAAIHEVLGVPHPSFKAVLCGLDKALMKECWAADPRVNYPASCVIESEGDIARFGERLKWPLIIKPTASSGSQGVGLAANRDEALRLLREARSYAGPGRVIAEQFVDGTHHDVNGIFWDGAFYPCGVGDRYFTPFPYCVPHHGYFPSELPLQRRKDLYDLLERGARSMGLTWGPVKADCVTAADKSYVYEISPRFHGDVFTSNVMGFLETRNPVHQLLSWIKAGAPQAFLAVDEEAGRVGGWRTLFNRADVSSASRAKGLFLKNNPERREIKNNDQIAGLAWAWGDSREEVDRLLGLT